MFNFKIIVYFIRKEIVTNIKNFLFFILCLLFFFLNFFLLYFSNVFHISIEEIDKNSLILSLIHLQMYIIPLFSLLLSYDILLKERELGILQLFLSYPFFYHNVLYGKIIGYWFIISISFFFGLIPIFIFLKGLFNSIIYSFFFLFFCMVLSFIFITFGTYISLFFKDRTIVILINIICWLFFVFFYDFLFIFFFYNSTIIIKFIKFFFILNPVESFKICSILYFSPLILEDIFGYFITKDICVYSFILFFFWFFIPFFSLSFVCSILNKRNQYVK